MLIRDPCKKCIVRACCTQVCNDKKEREYTIETLLYDINLVKNKTLNAIKWIGQDWVEIMATSALISIVLVEVVYVGYFIIKIIKN